MIEKQKSENASRLITIMYRLLLPPPFDVNHFKFDRNDSIKTDKKNDRTSTSIRINIISFFSKNVNTLNTDENNNFQLDFKSMFHCTVYSIFKNIFVFSFL